MDPDPFASSTISHVLGWVFSIPMFLALAGIAVQMLFVKEEGIPRLFAIWLFVCLLVFTPLRYIVLQIFTSMAFPWQSFGGFLISLVLALYVPILFGLLYALAFGAPMMLVALIAGKGEVLSKGRLWLAGICAPILFLVCSYLYYLILPVAAYSLHWVSAEDLMRATNGPAEYVYEYVAEPLSPMAFPAFTEEIGLEKMTPKERFRAHVAGLYCGDEAFAEYLCKSYPEYVKRKMSEERGGGVDLP